MPIQRLLIGLTLLNLALLAAGLAQMHSAVGAGVAPVLRGRALEILDEDGRVRASLDVLPATTRPDGSVHAETVLLRLITERGRPSVKIGASEDAAGMSLAGPTSTKDTYVIVEAKGTASSLRLRNEDGRERVVEP